MKSLVAIALLTWKAAFRFRLFLVLAMLLLASLALTAQVPSVAAKAAGAATVKTWTPTHTVDGQPDLQGTWTNASNVPLERSVSLGAKEFYTPEEAAANAKKGFQGDRPVTVEAHYDLSQFGLDPTQGKFAPNLRTSLIIGPEGRVILKVTPDKVKTSHQR